MIRDHEPPPLTYSSTHPDGTPDSRHAARDWYDGQLHDAACAWHGLPHGVQCSRERIAEYVNRNRRP